MRNKKRNKQNKGDPVDNTPTPTPRNNGMLTENQSTILANDIRTSTDPDVVAALSIRNDTELARLYNLDSDFMVWRENVTPDEYRDAMVWTEVDGLQTGKARIWAWLTQSLTIAVDATKANVRAGLAEVFPANQLTRGNLLAIAVENATVMQALYVTGVGTQSNPGVRTVIGDVTVNEIGYALNENP